MSIKQLLHNRKRIDGSALVWVVAVLSVLIVFVIGAVTASLVFATRTAKESLEAQMELTSQNAVDILLNKYCTGTVYGGGGASSPFDAISTGTTVGPIKVTFTSPEALSPMGTCNAYVKKKDENTVIISADTEYETYANATSSAIVKKKSCVGNLGIICSEGLELDGTAKMTLSNGTGLVLQDASVSSAGMPYPISGDDSTLIYTSEAAANFSGPKVVPSFSDTPVVTFDMPNGKYVNVKNDLSFSDEETKYKFNKSYSGSVYLAEGKEYYFQAKGGSSVNLDFGLYNSGSEASVVYIDLGDKAVDLTLSHIDNNVIVYVYGQNAVVTIDSSVSKLTGAVYAKTLVIGDNADVTFEYVNPTGVVGISTSDAETYTWEFVQYIKSDE